MLRVLAAVSAFAVLAGQQAPSLTARFIGNMAVALSDGSRTIVTDFPYESGYSSYMTYDAAEIRSPTAATLALITHRHRDHWEPSLFARTNWLVAGPADVVAGVPAGRTLPLATGATFGQVGIAAIETPHAGIGHHSYVVTWHDRRIYFSGDTEDVAHLARVRNLDVAFISPWLYRSALQRAVRIDTKRIVIYHHQADERVPECRADCLLPTQGQSIAIR